MQNKLLQGTVKRHPDGFGFFIPDTPEHADVYIPREAMKFVMTNDHVTIKVYPDRDKNRFRGEVVKIDSRGLKQIVGTFHILNEKMGIVRDDSKSWGTDLKIDMNDSMNAKDGELVSVEITSYPGDEPGFRGKVASVIGNAMDPHTDARRVLYQQQIPQEFSPKTLEEVKKFKTEVTPEDFKGRKDLRDLHLITIDGATAKDFDDAIYVETNDKGFLLFVAIADVSHYVIPGTALDKDAYERGTSVYFPQFVVPMLPEVLSNELCSLKPHVPRLCLVAEMQMDYTGEFTHTQFYEAVMQSQARVTYGEAQQMIDGHPIEKFADVEKDILRAADLAKVLMAKRFKEGSLDLEIPETEMILDGTGIPVDMIKSERLFAHRLIEELMLAANVAVAKFLSSKEIPALYRIHDSPRQEAIELLERYIHNFGGKANFESGKLQKRLTRVLQEFEGKPEAQVVNMLTLRSMSQAKYSAENAGHFGLGFEFYTHFTSPIRRYPDLIVHRLIKSQIMPTSRYRLMAEGDLQTAGSFLSATEQRSVKAERQFQSIKKARYMQQHIGEEFDGIISSVVKFGVFVLVRPFEVDGLVRLENLTKEPLRFDEENLWLVGARSGRKFTIGDQIRVKVVSADADSGQIDFLNVSENADAPATAQSKPEKGSRQYGSRDEYLAKRKKGGRGRSGREESRDKESRKRDDRSAPSSKGRGDAKFSPSPRKAAPSPEPKREERSSGASRRVNAPKNFKRNESRKFEAPAQRASDNESPTTNSGERRPKFFEILEKLDRNIEAKRSNTNKGSKFKETIKKSRKKNNEKSHRR